MENRILYIPPLCETAEITPAAILAGSDFTLPDFGIEPW